MWITMDALRAVAALWVFLFHISDPTGSILSFIPASGGLGVWIFFVVSGYCVSSSAQRVVADREGAHVFLWRRAMRIFPPFWLSILVVALVPFAIELVSAAKTGWLRWPVLSYRNLAPADWIEIVTLSRNIVSPDRGFFPPSAVYWTLAIEIQFYLALFLAMLCRLPLFATSTGLLFLAVVATAFDWQPYPGSFLPYWPAFWLGAALLWLRRRGAGSPGFVTTRGLPWARAGLVAIPSGLLMFLAWLMHARSDHYPLAAGYVVAIATVAFAWLAECVEVAPAARTKPAGRGNGPTGIALRMVVWVGTISYSVYLLHGQLHQLPAMFVRNLLPAGWDGLRVPLVMLLTIPLCGAFHRFAERPFILGRRGQSGAVPPAVAVVAP